MNIFVKTILALSILLIGPFHVEGAKAFSKSKPLNMFTCEFDEQYSYEATFVENYDGDTAKFNVVLGFGILYSLGNVRFYGINAPEIRTRDIDEKRRGLAAKNYVFEKLSNADYVLIKSIKDSKGKYGRYLVVVCVDGQNLNLDLVNKGYAEENYYD